MADSSSTDLRSRLPPDLAAGDQWLFRNPVESSVTPSSYDGISAELESHQRACAVFYVNTLSRMLKLPQGTAATASLYLHRFYMRQSLKHFPWRDMVPAALFLATKVEESVRRLRYIVECHFEVEYRREKAARGDAPVERVKADSEQWVKYRSLILYLEEELLNALCFDLSVEHPYTFLLRGVGHIFEASTSDLDFDRADRAKAAMLERIDRLTRAAWTVTSDSFATNLCVLHPPKAIAAMALLVGSRMLREPLPAVAGPVSASSDGVRPRKNWWELYEVSLDTLNAGAAVIVARYALSTDAHIAAEATKLSAFAQQLQSNGDAPTPPPPPSASLPAVLAATPPPPATLLLQPAAASPPAAGPSALSKSETPDTAMRVAPSTVTTTPPLPGHLASPPGEQGERAAPSASQTTPATASLEAGEHKLVEAEAAAQVAAGDAENAASRTL